MMRTLTPSAALLALAACGQPGANAPSAPQTPAGPTETAISEADFHYRVGELADDKYKGRAPGDPAGEAAADWIAAEFARMGLKPAFGDSWFQPVDMVSAEVDPATATLRLGAPDAAPLAYGNDMVVWSKRQTEGALVLDPTDIVFVGYGADAPEYDWNDFDGVDVAGKTLIILVNDPGYATVDPALFDGQSMTYYGRWTYKFEEAARKGAAAAFVVHETAPASYGWNVVQRSWTGPQPDLVRPDGGADRTILEGWITRETADALFAAAGRSFEAEKAKAATREFAPFVLEGVSAQGRIDQSLTPGQSRNVGAVLPGAAAADEHILYMAHWDHLGERTNFASPDDTIYNGAVDNATGTAAILEIAESFAGAEARPARSISFIAVTLEESGILGSEYYAQNPSVPLNRLVAGINIDALMPLGRARDMTVVGVGKSDMDIRLARVLAETGRTITPDTTPEAGFFYRSDHISLAKVGVPMLYASAGGDLLEGGVEASREARARYTTRDYHQPSDEYSPDWPMASLVDDAGALAEVGWRLANSDEWPQWSQTAEFRAVREASLAAGK